MSFTSPPSPPMMAPTDPTPAAKGGSPKAGIVLGLIGAVLGFIPGALYVGVVLGIVALIIGSWPSAARQAEGRARSSPERSRS